MHRRSHTLGLLLFLLVVFAGQTQSANSSMQVLVNSIDWKDAYAGSVYAMHNDADFSFLSSVEQANIMNERLSFSAPILLIESPTRPFYSNYAGYLRENGFTVKEVLLLPTKGLNSELGKRSGADKFIVLDGKYGYNAVSAITYAVRNKGWVLFAEDMTPDELKAYLKQQGATEVMQYGSLKKSVADALAEFKPEVIDKGDRFNNNFALLKKMQAKKRDGQLLLSNGEMIERTLFMGPNAILLIGRQSVPPIVVDFIREENVLYGVLVGKELYPVSKWIKDNTVMKYVFVKFAQTFVSKTTPVAEPWELDIIYLPILELNITIGEVQYNTKTSELEVTYNNNGEHATYLRGTAEVYMGETVNKASDKTTWLLEPKSQKTAVYLVETKGQQVVEDTNVSVKINAVYGEEKGALERVVEKWAENLAIISFSDESALSVGNFTYDVSRQGFDVEVINEGPVDVFFKPYITLTVSEEKEMVTIPKAMKARVGASAKAFVSAPYDAEQLASLDDATISVRVDYGAREAYLIRRSEEQRLFTKVGAPQLIVISQQADWLPYAAGAAALVALYLIFGRKRGQNEGGWSSRRRYG